MPPFMKGHAVEESRGRFSAIRKNEEGRYPNGALAGSVNNGGGGGGGGMTEDAMRALHKMLSTAYLMILENGWVNERQLREYARVDGWLRAFWFEEDVRVDAWPPNYDFRAVTMWLFWFLLRPGSDRLDGAMFDGCGPPSYNIHGEVDHQIGPHHRRNFQSSGHAASDVRGPLAPEERQDELGLLTQHDPDEYMRDQPEAVPVVSDANGPRPKLANTGKQVLNLASYNFPGLAGDEVIKLLPSWVSTVLLRPRSSAPWEFSAIPCVISAFAERGDNIVADRGVNFAIPEEQSKKYHEYSISPHEIELKHKYKYRLILNRLILDESISFGTATQIDMIIGSVPTRADSLDGFCAGSLIVVDHQHINSTSFVFFAAVPALLMVSASEGINILRNTPSILSMLQQENVRAIWTVLDRVEAIMIPSHAASPIIHIRLQSAATLYVSASMPAKPSYLQPLRRIMHGRSRSRDFVDEALAQGRLVYCQTGRRAFKEPKRGSGFGAMFCFVVGSSTRREHSADYYKFLNTAFKFPSRHGSVPREKGVACHGCYTYVLKVRRVTNVGYSLQQGRTHDHVPAHLARVGGLGAHRCALRRSIGGGVPEGHCSSKIGRVRRSLETLPNGKFFETRDSDPCHYLLASGYHVLDENDLNSEVSRLKTQYSHWKAVFDSNTVPPVININHVGKVIEVATGTGAWDLDFVSHPDVRDRGVQVFACDISAAKFPQADKPDVNKITFFRRDVTKPFPDEVLGTFDLVNMSCMCLALTVQGWKSVPQNLQPGGHLILRDIDFMVFTHENPSLEGQEPNLVTQSKSTLATINRIFSGWVLRQGGGSSDHTLSYHFRKMLQDASLRVLSYTRALSPHGKYCSSHKGLNWTSLSEFATSSSHVVTLAMMKAGCLELGDGTRIVDEEERKALMRELQHFVEREFY
ncbi:hypothetical protein EDB84DRAFT_1638129 [Lactarius hengduanensis]|nr:hypothetical protein EDB84DRAFT_1638129 [Lactarius hengduanensis]